MQYQHFNFLYSPTKPIKLIGSPTYYCILYPNYFYMLDSHFNFLRKIYLPSLARNCIFVKHDTIIFAGESILMYNFNNNVFKVVEYENAVLLSSSVFRWKNRIEFYFSTNQNIVYRVSEDLQINKVYAAVNRITALHKYKCGLVIGEESGLVSIRVREHLPLLKGINNRLTEENINNRLTEENNSSKLTEENNSSKLTEENNYVFKFIEIKLENPIYDINSFNNQLIITDSAGFAYLFKNNKLINKIKIQEGPLLTTFLKKNIYFIGLDSILLKYTNNELEKRSISKSKIINLITNNNYLSIINEDSIIITVKEDIFKVFVNERAVKYSNDCVIYKDCDGVRIYNTVQLNDTQSNDTQSNDNQLKCNQSNDKSNDQLNGKYFNEPEELIFKSKILTNHNRNTSKFKLKIIINNIQYYSISNNYFVYSNNKLTYLFKLLNNKLIFIKQFNYSGDCFLFNKYLILINEEILIINLENELSHSFNYNLIFNTKNYLIIGNEVYNSELTKINTLNSIPILIYEFNDILFTLHSVSFLSYKLIYKNNCVPIKGYLIKDFLINKNNLFFIDSNNLYLMDLESKCIEKMELGYLLDSLCFSGLLLVSKFDMGYCSKNVLKVEKNQYMKK